jgi:hypothetical protein
LEAADGAARKDVSLRPRGTVRAVWLVAALAAPVHPGTPREILQRALTRLRAEAGNLSRYACVETVERQYFRAPEQPAAACTAATPAAGRLEAVDRLRLEVTFSGGHEIYSWPGATRFDSRDVSEIVREGPIATGSFGTHLLGIFDNPGVRFEFAGERHDGARRLLEYRFTVPLEASRYHVRAGSVAETIPYRGSFRLNADSLELDRLTFQAEPNPAATSMCALDAELDYSPVPAHGDLLLPERGQLRIGFQSGRQTNNVTTFAACREYTANSEVVFEEAPSESAAAPAASRTPQIALPIGLPVTVEFTAPIDSATAAAGDLVVAKVVHPVRRAGSADTLIPAGAAVHGRLTRVERHLLPEPYFLFAMSFNRLDWDGASHRFAARLEPSAELMRRLGANALSEGGGGVRYWSVGVLLFPSGRDRWVIPAGYKSKWMTLAVRARP